MHSIACRAWKKAIQLGFANLMRRYLNEGKIDSLNDEIFVRAEPIPVQCYLAELAMLAIGNN